MCIYCWCSIAQSCPALCDPMDQASSSLTIYIYNMHEVLWAHSVKNPPATQETPVRFLGGEDPLEKGTATHSSILGLPWWISWLRIRLQGGRPGFNPWIGKIPCRREQLPIPVFWPGEFHAVHGVAKSQTRLGNFHFFMSCCDRQDPSWLQVVSTSWYLYPRLSPPLIASHLKAHLLIKRIQQKFSWWPTG